MPSFFSPLRNTKGTVLMEVVVSFFVLVVGLTGALSVIVAVGNINAAHKDRFIAANLAQEGIEAVRGMRDTNWLVYSSSLRECWNFWEDTDENGVIDSRDTACIPQNGQNAHPFKKGLDGAVQRFIVDFDPNTFRWALVSEDRLSTASLDPSKDYADHFRLYERIFNGRSFYTHNRATPGDTPSIFSREIEMYYLDNPSFVDNGDGTFSGGEFPDGAKDQDNRILVLSRVTWFERGHERELVLSTLLTDFFARTEWNS